MFVYSKRCSTSNHTNTETRA